MWSFLTEKRNSSKVAKDRMKLLLVSERMNCSPQIIAVYKILEVFDKMSAERQLSVCHLEGSVCCC